MLKRIKILLRRAAEPVFLLFLSSAAIVWYLVQLNDVYQRDITVPIYIEGIENPSHANGKFYFDVNIFATGKGYYFLLYNLFPTSNIIRTDISNVTVKDEQSGKNIISQPSLEKVISDKLGDLTLSRIYNTNINVNLSSIVEKYVPVLPLISDDFDGGYMQIGTTFIEPCSVLVRGDIDILRDVHSVSTRMLRLNENNKKLSGIVALDVAKGVTVSPAEVGYRVDIDRFTEVRLNTAIEIHTDSTVLNNYEFTIIPSNVEIGFNIAQSTGTSFDADSYAPYVDYDPEYLHEEIDNQVEDNLYKVRVKKLPIGVKVQYVEPEYVTILKNNI